MNLSIILLELLAKSAGILLVGLAVAAAMRRCSASQQHVLWVAVLAALLFLPATKLIRPYWHWGESLGALSSVGESRSSIKISPEEAAHLDTVPSLPSGWGWPDLLPLFVGVWLSGVLALLGYRLVGRWQVIDLQRRSRSTDDARLSSLARDAANEMGFLGSYEIRLAEDAAGPCMWDAAHPVILLPADALSWEQGKLRAVLRHELGHVVRRDCFSRELAHLVCALYWPNPLVWLAARRLYAAQERACDDLVLSAGTAETEYASLLLETIRATRQFRFCADGVISMARPSTLEGRVFAIVDATRNRRPAGRVSVYAAAVGALGVLLMSAAAQVVSEPAELEPTAKLADGRAAVLAKAEALTTPGMAFPNVPISEALRLLSEESRRVDPEKKGISFVLELAPGEEEKLPLVNDSFIRKISILRLAKILAWGEGLEVQAEGDALVLRKREASAANLSLQHRFLECYLWVQEGDKLTENKQWASARQKYEAALKGLKSLPTDWEPVIVKYRIRYCQERIAALRGKNDDPETASNPPPQKSPPPTSVFKYLVGVPMKGRPGFITSPYALDAGPIDVRGFPPGTQLRCPYTKKIFIAP